MQWSGMLVIDGRETYNIMGDPEEWATSATQEDVTISATRSIFQMTAGSINMTLTFLSPAERDPVKMSMPFSYLNVELATNDGKDHDVALYTDISARASIPREASIS
jgi:hypothetical protein